MNFWNLLLLEMIKYKTWKIQTHTYIVLWLRKVFRMKGAMLYPVIFIMHTFMVPEQTYASHLPFGVFPVLRGFSFPPAWSLSTGPWELHGRFASAQALSLISEAPVESSPAAHLHVNWPNPNSNPLQPECFLWALIWHQNNRLFLSSFTFSFDSSLILLLTRSAKWIPEKRQACCLVLERKDAVGIEKCSFCPSF